MYSNLVINMTTGRETPSWQRSTSISRSLKEPQVGTQNSFIENISNYMKQDEENIE